MDEEVKNEEQSLEERVSDLEEAVNNLGDHLFKFMQMQFSINDTLRELVVRKYGKHELNTALKEIEAKFRTNLKKENEEKSEKTDEN